MLDQWRTHKILMESKLVCSGTKGRQMGNKIQIVLYVFCVPIMMFLSKSRLVNGVVMELLSGGLMFCCCFIKKSSVVGAQLHNTSESCHRDSGKPSIMEIRIKMFLLLFL